MVSFELIVRLLLSTGVVVGGLLALRWWSSRATGRGRGAIKVVARAGLSRSTAVAVIDVGQHRYLIGAGEHSVNLLAELDQGDDLTGAGSGDPLRDSGPVAAQPDSEETFGGVLHRTSVSAEGPALEQLMRDRPGNGPLAHLRRWTTRVPREVRIHGLDN